MSYRIRPIPFTEVELRDEFWRGRLETNRTVTLPHDLAKCEETGRIANFAKAGGLMEGPFQGIAYDDADVYKVLEGAAYSLASQWDDDLDARLDDIIEVIEASQEEDGYLYTARTIDPINVPTTDATNLLGRTGPTRWSYLAHSHELYNAGHLYEAAVAHHRATGKHSLLDIAIKNAALIAKVFGPDKRRDVPGHQEIELGLVKLYEVTGDPSFVDLAEFFLDERGHQHDRSSYGAYAQDHAPVGEQDHAVGHAVRATYMYSAMADVAAIKRNAAYVRALDRIWEDVVGAKLYLTGGIGAQHRGEAFGEPHDLPNLTAYAETCAAIANMMWNHRMFLLHGDAKYVDVLERTLYNGFLAGVSLQGTEFFYANPLESDGDFEFNRDGSATRRPWFSCSCCPTNVVRALPSLPTYLYAVRDDVVYVNLFASSATSLDIGGTSVGLRQETRYPWIGDIRISVDPAQALEFALRVRVPGWARGRPVPSDLYSVLDATDEAPTLTVNGRSIEVDLDQGYAVIRRRWEPGDVVDLHLPMPVRRVVSSDLVEANHGRVAIERGPIVYCAEHPDNAGTVLDRTLPDSARLDAVHVDHELGRMVLVRVVEAPDASPSRPGSSSPVMRALIPYFAWSHRGIGEMAVWIRRGDLRPVDGHHVKEA